MNQPSVFEKVSVFLGFLEEQKSSKELYEEALKLCDQANDGVIYAQNRIDSVMDNEESPLNGFFAITGTGFYVLTDMAKFESTRGAML